MRENLETARQVVQDRIRSRITFNDTNNITPFRYVCAGLPVGVCETVIYALLLQ